MNERELDHMLRAIHLERMAYQGSDAAIRHALSSPIEQTRQRRFVLPPFSRWRFQPMFSATKFVVAGAIVALFGGFLLAGVLPTRPGDVQAPLAGASRSAPPATVATAPPQVTAPPTSPESIPHIELPTNLPEDVRSGAVETPIGQARWVHLSGPLGSLPGNGEIMPWGDGIAVWDPVLSQLFATSDGVSWASVALPEDMDRGIPGHRRGSTLRHVDGSYVLISPGPGLAWTSAGDGRWIALDASALGASTPAGWGTLRSIVEVGPVATGDDIVFGVEHLYQLPVSRFGVPAGGGTREMVKLARDRYGICSPGGCPERGPRWVLRFKDVPDGLAVIDHKTGERLGTIEGAQLSQLYEGEWGHARAFFAIDGDTITRIESPWPGLKPTYSRGYVFTPSGTTPLPRQWRRGDGGEYVPPPTLVSAMPRDGSLTIRELRGGLAAEVDGTPLAWESSDGETWTGPPDEVPPGALPRWTGSGWVAFPASESSEQGWAHLGGRWISIDDLIAAAEWGLDADSMTSIGNVTLFYDSVFGGGPVGLYVMTDPDGG